MPTPHQLPLNHSLPQPHKKQSPKIYTDNSFIFSIKHTHNNTKNVKRHLSHIPLSTPTNLTLSFNFGLKKCGYQDLNIIPLQRCSFQKMKAKSWTGVEFEAVDRDIEKLFGCEDERDVEKLFGCEDERQLFGCEDERQLFGCVQQKIHLFGCEDERVIEKQPRSPVLSLNGSNLSYRKACQILCQAAMKDKWSLAEPILKEKPSFVREEISKQRDTMLHLATAARSTRVLRELIKLMDVGDLELKNNDESTAFFVAAVTGTVEIAKAMRERNNNLPNIRGEDGILPIEVAALFGYKDMVSYLFKVTDLDVLSQEERLRLLQATTQSEMYEVSLDIFRKDRQLASKILQGNVDVLHILAHKSLAISNQVVAYSPWRKFITNTISMATRQFIPYKLSIMRF